MLKKSVLFVSGLSDSSGFSSLFGHSLVQPKNQTDQTDQTNKTDALERLADFFSILIEIHHPAHTCTRLIEGGTVQSIQIGPGERFPPPNPK